MLVELILLTSGAINWDCYREKTPSFEPKYGTGYVQSTQVESLTPERSCKNVDFCRVQFSSTQEHKDHVYAKGSCVDVAKKLRSK